MSGFDKAMFKQKCTLNNLNVKIFNLKKLTESTLFSWYWNIAAKFTFVKKKYKFNLVLSWD